MFLVVFNLSGIFYSDTLAESQYGWACQLVQFIAKAHSDRFVMCSDYAMPVLYWLFNIWLMSLHCVIITVLN